MSGCYMPSGDKPAMCQCGICVVNKQLKEIDAALKSLFARVKELESYDERIHDLENIGAESRLIRLEEVVKELERFQEITHLEYKNNRLKSNKPHKCPVCDRFGMECFALD